MRAKKALLVLGVLALVLGTAMPASATVLVWKVRSTYPYIVYLEFYSQDRNAVWPGAGEVYFFDHSDWQTFRLSCNHGELICYGAWTKSREAQWGVGEADSMNCSDCCAVCGGAARQTTLTD